MYLKLKACIMTEYKNNPTKLANAAPTIPYIGISHQLSKALVPNEKNAKNHRFCFCIT